MSRPGQPHPRSQAAQTRWWVHSSRVARSGRFLAEDPHLVLSLDELLTRLAEEDATAARVAHLHLFGGLSVEEAGAAAGFSRAAAYRNWKYARAWLRAALEK